MFKIYDGRSEFYQWDLNRQIVLSDPTINEVHFCNKTSDCSLVVEVYEKDGLRLADVPNILLQTDWPIRVYAYCGDCYTKTSDTFKVIARTRPDDYVYTETEVKRWEDLANEIDEKINQYEHLAIENEAFLAESGAVLDELQMAENHERRITQLEKHISNDYFVTDDSAAYNKIVDVSACPYAQVNSLGGMTYKSVNYFDKSKVTNATETNTGFKFTNTANIDSAFAIGCLRDLAPNLKVGDVVTFYCKTINPQSNDARGFLYIGSPVRVGWYGGDYITITEEHLSAAVYAYGKLNQVCEYNDVIITKEENAPYSPYFEGLRDTKVTELVSEGANLLNIQAEVSAPSDTAFDTTTQRLFIPNTMIVGIAPNNYYAPHRASLVSRTQNSITFKNQGGYGVGFAFDLKPNTKYAISCKSSTNLLSLVAAFYNADGSFDNYYYPETYFTTNSSGKTVIVFFDGNSVENETTITISDIMLNYGTTVAPYKRYRGTLDTLAISAELRAFLEDKGYGRGVSGYPNYIDFERKVFVQNTYEVDIGSFNYEYRVSNGRNMFRASLASLGIQGQISANIPINALAEDYRAVSCNATWIDRDMAYGSTVVGYTAIEFVDNRYTSAAAFKEAVTGKKLLFALEKPIEHDISEYLTDENIIEVEGGGTITAINEYDNAAPSSITYLLQEGSV